MQAPKKVDLLLSGCDVVAIDGKNKVIRDGAVDPRYQGASFM